MDKTPAVYILANGTNRVLYIGVTSNLTQRLAQHQSESIGGFTTKYHVHKLVYFEVHGSMESAITREKQLKGGSREDKLKLIEKSNPGFQDLSHLVR